MPLMQNIYRPILVGKTNLLELWFGAGSLIFEEGYMWHLGGLAPHTPCLRPADRLLLCYTCETLCNMQSLWPFTTLLLKA